MKGGDTTAWGQMVSTCFPKCLRRKELFHCPKFTLKDMGKGFWVGILSTCCLSQEHEKWSARTDFQLFPFYFIHSWPVRLHPISLRLKSSVWASIHTHTPVAKKVTKRWYPKVHSVFIFLFWFLKIENRRRF